MTGVSLGKVNPLCPGYLAAAMDEFVARVETQDPNELQFIIESFEYCLKTFFVTLQKAD